MAAQKRGEAFFEEAQAGPEDDGSREDEVEIIEVLCIDDAHQPVMERLIGMTGHFEHEQRQGEDEGDRQIPLQRCLFALVHMGVVVGGVRLVMVVSVVCGAAPHPAAATFSPF
ncbi:hypothetical protein D3C73_1156880 [compost metagenome]